MDIIITESEIYDVKELEDITSRCYSKFKLDDLGFKYQKDVVKTRFSTFHLNDVYRVFTAKIEDKIVGFVVSVLMETLYSEQKLMQEIGMQADPDLSKTQQAKIIINLIGHCEAFCNENKVDLLGFSIMPMFDISAYLINRGYTFSDKVLLKNNNNNNKGEQ
jgi:hypothetical protein